MRLRRMMLLPPYITGCMALLGAISICSIFLNIELIDIYTTRSTGIIHAEFGDIVLVLLGLHTVDSV
jgi:hypothetical protein